MANKTKATPADTALMNLAGWRNAAGRVSAVWNGWSFARQFVLAAAVVIFVSMIAIGIWLSAKVEQGVVQSTAAAASLYMDAHIAPLAQELATSDTISPANSAKLTALFESEKIRGSVAAVKIWKRGGAIAWSTWPELIGKTFSPTEPFQRAWTGTVSAEFDGLRHEDDALERSIRTKLLEVYAPLRERSTDRIIAVMEFYLRADSLPEDLRSAVQEAWVVVGSATTLIMIALSGIVGRASKTIETQKQSLRMQVRRLHQLLERNRELSERVRLAHGRSSEVSEQLLKRVGADLHDGPAQLLGLALLDLDSLAPHPSRPGRPIPTKSDFDTMRRVLQDAMADIRSLSAGLVLPELDSLALQDVVQRVIVLHQERTHHVVEVKISEELPLVPRTLKACIYRLIQEALNNVHKHAHAQLAIVEARCRDRKVEIVVKDNGTGFDPTERPDRIGLTVMRDRVETIGGTLSVQSGPRGTSIVAQFDLDALNLAREANA